tara:strand:+ start:1004 stop:1273 length:270 start_codon:yes stop_codon:yes gene_type:complete
MLRSVIAAAISCSIAMISIVIMILEETITPEAWALLLITPIPVAISITTYRDSEEEASDSMEDWDETNEEETDGNVGDPADAGFDVPVL